MNELSVNIEYKGFRKLASRDVLMALNDYFRHAGQGDKMEIKAVSSPAVEAVAEIERLTEAVSDYHKLTTRQREQIETLRAALNNAAGAIETILPLANGYMPLNQTYRAKQTCNRWLDAAKVAWEQACYALEATKES